MKSTSTTTINHTNYGNSFIYAKEEVGIIFGSQLNAFSMYPKFNKKEKHVLDFISEQPKVFIDLTNSFYHFMHENFGEFLIQYELTPNAKFIINISGFANKDPLPSFIQIFFKFLNKNKVDYIAVDLFKQNKFNINNLYYRNPDLESFEINDPWPKIHKMSKDFVLDLNFKADKKVYLSRKNYKNRDLTALIKGRLPHNNDDRMDNEAKVEDYFKSLGFEIVAPDEFKTFEEQINYFSQAKMLVSTTSSGFVNAAFMNPGSSMVEFTTPLISFTQVGNGITEPSSVGQEEIHHFYHGLASSLDHKYFSLSNRDRSSTNIINVIENDAALKAWLQA